MNKIFLLFIFLLFTQLYCNKTENSNCIVAYGINLQNSQQTKFDNVRICFDAGFDNDSCQIWNNSRKIFDKSIKSDMIAGCSHSVIFVKNAESERLIFKFKSKNCQIDVPIACNSIKIFKNKENDKLTIWITNIPVIYQ